MKKRICFLMDSIFSIGGVQRVTAVIAKELAKECDVTIVTFDKRNPYNGMCIGAMTGLREKNIPPEKMTKLPKSAAILTSSSCVLKKTYIKKKHESRTRYFNHTPRISFFKRVCLLKNNTLKTSGNRSPNVNSIRVFIEKFFLCASCFFCSANS